MRLLERGELIGYIPETKQLIVTLSEVMATKMAADGWNVKCERELGYFITIELTA
ncbi:MAG TPA: hypothetical protein VN843_04395 [Anaerolineales bacterium]|nr:hypothetical protein [Anaerolineales bacterium]